MLHAQVRHVDSGGCAVAHDLFAVKIIPNGRQERYGHPLTGEIFENVARDPTDRRSHIAGIAVAHHNGLPALPVDIYIGSANADDSGLFLLAHAQIPRVCFVANSLCLQRGLSSSAPLVTFISILACLLFFKRTGLSNFPSQHQDSAEYVQYSPPRARNGCVFCRARLE
ncbi:hypothetical protein SDC9_118939 [bioreactor metagenome]|uniref:Uncharacterized protein n=1 Tax=bioreactor metagenome TaxID=1076179 RepID=A0A645C433_9ZZZZ